MENGWQYCKVYPCHVDSEGNPTNEYFEWAKKGKQIVYWLIRTLKVGIIQLLLDIQWDVMQNLSILIGTVRNWDI
jgi:hypothetical protein